MQYSPYITKFLDGVATIGDGVVLRESQIPGAGMGLFADRNFLRDDVITFYDGPVVEWEKLPANKRRPENIPPSLSSHMKNIFKNKYVAWGNVDKNGRPLPEISDRALKGRGGLAFANDAYNSRFYNNTAYERIDGRTNTAALMDFNARDIKIDPRDSVIVMRALVNIPRGTELFANYGDFQWGRTDDMLEGVDLVTADELRNAIYRPEKPRKPIDRPDPAAEQPVQKKKRRVAPMSVPP